MANEFRGPLIVGRRDPPIQTATQFIGPSLLATTLAIAGQIPLPLGASHLGPPTQGHNSAPRNFVNADTSRGTPKTLIADAKTAQFLTPQRAPQQHGRNEFLNSDTSQDTPKTLFGDATTPANNKTASAPYILRLGADTSQDIPTPLFAATPPPLVNSPASFAAHWVRRLEIRGDSSQGIPKALTSDSSVPPFNAPHLTADRIKPVADTSLSTPLALKTPVVVTTSVTRGPLLIGRHDMPRQTALGADTSRGMPKAFLLDDVASAQMGEALPLVRFPHNPGDTSRGTFAGLFAGPVAAPVVNVQYLPPDALKRIGSDTTQSTPVTLSGFIAPPIVNPQFLAPSLTRQVQDTSQDTPKPLFADAAMPLNNPPYPTPDKVRAVTDTSRGLNVALANFVPPAPFVQSDWPAPIAYKQNLLHNWDAQAAVWTIPDAIVLPSGGGWYGDELKKKRTWLVKVGETTHQITSEAEAHNLLARIEVKATADKQAPKVELVEAPVAKKRTQTAQTTRDLRSQIKQLNEQLEAQLRQLDEDDDEAALILLL